MPLWVKPFNIPSVYLTKRGICAIASNLEKPLFADETTSNASYLDFARVCIEMNAGSDFSNLFKVMNERKDKFTIRVEYESIPRTCLVCSTFGHTFRQCPNAKVDILTGNDEQNRSTHPQPPPVSVATAKPCLSLTFKTNCLDIIPKTNLLSGRLSLQATILPKNTF